MSRWMLALTCLSALLVCACEKAPGPPPVSDRGEPESNGIESAQALSLPATIAIRTDDGVEIFGERYYGDLDASAPLIMLFHQGGSNGRGEYGALAPWLNQAGYRAIAWDQRTGGDMFGETNRTRARLPAAANPGYCDAYTDLQTALEFIITGGEAEKVIVWGSSYSGALVFRLAAENPERVSHVLAFSPASGGTMVDCRARLWAEEVRAPKLALRPVSEMSRASSVEQRTVLETAGVTFLVVANGIHGSSMLVDTRTDHDMSEARAAVLDWLRQ